MKNNIEKIVLANTLGLVIIIAFLFYSHFNSTKKIVYVNSMELFEQFKMTKELKRTGEKQFNEQKTVVEGLYNQLQDSSITEDQKKVIMQEFMQRKEALEAFNQNFAIEESAKIWKRISSYIKEYAQQNSYDIILGADQNQTVLYANEQQNLTKEVLRFINSKYEGKILK
jgi:outer membrane protein